jgi:hypothetical protein
MRDAERQRLERLIAWRPPQGVITTYFDIDRGDRGDGWRVQLRDGLDELQEPDDHEGKLALRETVKRVLERFDPQDQPPPGRAQVGFVEVARKRAGEDWSSLQIPLRKTLELVRSVIDAAMTSKGRGVVGVNETSEALVEGRVEHLLMDSDGRFSLEQLSPPARESVDDPGQLDGAELMIELALRTSADLTPVGGEAAETLSEHGGAAALLRY